MRPLTRDAKMLSIRERKYLAEYMATGSHKKATAFAGLKSAQGMLKRPHVKAELKRLTRELMAKKKVTSERVVEELSKIAFANIDDFVDDEYRIQPKPRRRKMAAVHEVTTETILDKREDGDEDVKRVKIKMYSKLDALNALGRHFGIFKDKIEISGELGDRLDRAFDKLEKDGATPHDEHDHNDADDPTDA